MNMMIDLHSHTTASDGSLTPTQLVDHAVEMGLSAIAITDHDTTAGLDEALAHAQKNGIEVIPGIEISSVVEGCDVHIVGLYINHKHPKMIEQMDEMKKTRNQRNINMVKRLAEAGIEISEKDLERFSGRTIARGHIAAILIERGYAENLKDALAKYMVRGTVGYVQRVTPPPNSCIQMIHDSGGLAFIAHINQIDRNNWKHGEAICRQVLEAGADGLETLYCDYDDMWRQRAESLAIEYGVLRSGGSDFHGAIKNNLELGIGYGDLHIPYDFLIKIKARFGNT